MNGKINVFNIQHFSLHDGPGIRTVIFLKGCPLDCVWCHNPESKSAECELSFLNDKCIKCGKCAEVCRYNVHLIKDDIHGIKREKCELCGACVDVCMTGALDIIGKKYGVDEIMEELEKDNIFFGSDGGVTFSGGEPFAQFDSLYILLKRCKEKGYSVCIETSGFAKSENVVKAAEYTDYFLYDCKETDANNHKKYTGADNETIIKNLEILNDIKAAVILRCPIIPGVNDRKNHFENIANLSNRYSCIKSVEFMPYHPLGICKSEQIGKKCLFGNNNFCDKKDIEKYLNEIKDNFKVSFKVN